MKDKIIFVFAVILFSFLLIGCNKKEEQIEKKEEKMEKKFRNWDAVVESVFPTSMRKSASFNDGYLKIELKERESAPGYYDTGDKVNKILAIESVRLFYKIPVLKKLDLSLNINSGNYYLIINKEEIEDFYAIDIEELREFYDTGELRIGDKWRESFINLFDNKDNRMLFFEKFVNKKIK